MKRDRAFKLVYILFASTLFLPRISSAYFPAPLSPRYITECDTQCQPTDTIRITDAPITPGRYDQPSLLIGYAYTTPVSGTVPVYVTQCQTQCSPTDSLKITSTPITPNRYDQPSALIGYVYNTQISGTAPVYLTRCGTQCLPYASLKTTSTPITPGRYDQPSVLVGYLYPSLPPSSSYTLSPTYFIGSVIYLPPGQGPSSITYGAGTVTGTTVSSTSSWSNNSSIGLSYAGFSISFGDDFGGSSTNSVDAEHTYNQSTTYKGPASNSINHDYDQILIYLGVKVQVTVDYLGNVVWSPDFSQIASAGYAETGYPISVGCLRSNSTIPASQCTATISLLNSAGVTSADYPSIIGADPFSSPSAPLSPDQNRFKLIDSVNFLPSPTTSTITYTENNSTTITNSVTSNYSYSVGAGGSYSFLKADDKFTWGNSSTVSNKTGSTDSSSFTLSLPSAPYSGPSTIFVYFDTIYKTFMFSFNQ